MKYIIEINDTPMTTPELGKKLYKAKGFNSLVFDQNGLDKLEKTNETKWFATGYQTGYDTAIENAQATKLDWGEVQYTKGYNQAINDYNEMVKYAINNQSEFKDFLFEKYGLSDCLIGIQFLNDVAIEYDMAEITSELKKWREEKKKAEEETIKVGDVICSEISNVKALVIYISEWDNYHCLHSDGTMFTLNVKEAKYWTKVGHFGEVSQLLDKLKGESEVIR